MEEVTLHVLLRPDGTFDVCACGAGGYRVSEAELAEAAAPILAGLAPRSASRDAQEGSEDA